MTDLPDSTETAKLLENAVVSNVHAIGSSMVALSNLVQGDTLTSQDELTRAAAELCYVAARGKAFYDIQGTDNETLDWVTAQLVSLNVGIGCTPTWLQELSNEQLIELRENCQAMLDARP